MSDSAEYKRGYAKGYSTGCRRADADIQRAQAYAHAAALRAERLEQALRIGPCEACRHWSRGAGEGDWQSCHWGLCCAGSQAGSRNGTWVRGDNGPVTTSSKFGCVLFLPEFPPAAADRSGRDNAAPDSK